MEEMETSSFPVFFLKFVFTYDLHLTSEPPPLLHTACYAEVAAIAADDCAAAVHRAVFPPCFLCVDVRLPVTLQRGAGLFSQIGPWMPKGLHLCQTPISDIKLNCL